VPGQHLQFSALDPISRSLLGIEYTCDGRTWRNDGWHNDALRRTEDDGSWVFRVYRVYRDW